MTTQPDNKEDRNERIQLLKSEIPDALVTGTSYSVPEICLKLVGYLSINPTEVVAACMEMQEESKMILHWDEVTPSIPRFELLPAKKSKPSLNKDGLPAEHVSVIATCVAEAWRNYENGDSEAQSKSDIAVDIINQLQREYLGGEVTFIVNPKSRLGHWPAPDSSKYERVSELAISLLVSCGYADDYTDTSGEPIGDKCQSSLMDAMFRAPDLAEKFIQWQMLESALRKAGF